MPAPISESTTSMVAQLVEAGKITFFLGAGVNMGSGRAGPRPPSSQELAAQLNRAVSSGDDDSRDLLRISHQVAVTWGWQHLYDELHGFFEEVHEPGPVHRFLANLPARLRGQGLPPPLVITTNYDDMLEQALADSGEPFDLLRYEARPDHEHLGAMMHQDPSGDETWVLEPNTFVDLPDHQRALVVKIHGSFVRENPQQDAYVISEDDYIDYMTRAPMDAVLPVNVVNRLKDTHVLFLGYALRDWNLRGLIRKLWGPESQPTRTRWSVQLRPSDLDRTYWLRYGVNIIDADVDAFVDSLGSAMEGPEET